VPQLKRVRPIWFLHTTRLRNGNPLELTFKNLRQSTISQAIPVRFISLLLERQLLVDSKVSNLTNSTHQAHEALYEYDTNSLFADQCRTIFRNSLAPTFNPLLAESYSSWDNPHLNGSLDGKEAFLFYRHSLNSRANFTTASFLRANFLFSILAYISLPEDLATLCNFKQRA